MTKSTSSAMCNSGNIARRIEFNTICKPEHDQHVLGESNAFAISSGFRAGHKRLTQTRTDKSYGRNTHATSSGFAKSYMSAELWKQTEHEGGGRGVTNS